jgi:hypothetical protein
MSGNKPRVSSGKWRQHKSTPSRARPRRDEEAGVAAALREIQRVLDTPLAELMESQEERAAAEALTQEARAVPAMVRLGKLVAFVGNGRPATQAGNLKAPDAVAVARLLRAGDDVSGAVRSMDDLPDVAHDFRWAMAAELLAARGTKIVAGPWVRDLERDPLAAWLRVATTLLEHGLLDGFRRGWRKSYVDVSWPAADQWIFIHTTGHPRIAAISRIAEQFTPGRTPQSFPQLDGWCCTTTGSAG